MDIHPLYGEFQTGFRPYLHDDFCQFRLRAFPFQLLSPPDDVTHVRAAMITFFPQDVQDHIGYLDGDSKNTNINNLIFFQGFPKRNANHDKEVLALKRRLQTLVQEMEMLTKTAKNIINSS